MHRHVRKISLLVTVCVTILSLTVGALAAHEGRPVGDYRIIVGWLEEPTYEGARNAVSVRVNKIVEAAEAEAMGVEGDDHGPPGHHDEETPPSSESTSEVNDEPEDHHATTGEHSHDGDAGHHDDQNGSNGTASMAHGEGGHHDSTIEAAGAMAVAFTTSADSVSGLNVSIATEGFTFAPQNVNGAHVEGEGHAHIYVNGVKISRVYTPWYYLGDLEPGDHEIRVTLNANSHEEYTYGGDKVEATAVVTVPESHGHHHGAETVAAQAPMSVSISLAPDPLGGANLFVTDTVGFTFAPENAGDHHVAGEGHAHIYVNDVEVSRLYGNAYQLDKMAAGTNEVRVTLTSNEHSVYTWNGEAVQATATIDIPEGMGGEGYEEAGHGHSRVTTGSEDNSGGVAKVVGMHGTGKPLASPLGQDEGVAISVQGLEGSLQVEVRHVATGAARTLSLEAVAGDPGHYIAGLVPTAPGVYEFRVFGDLEGTAVDETFTSYGAGGGFDDVQTSAELQFPVVLPEVREIESGVRGAMQTAQQAQDAAMAAQDDSGNALTIVALIVGIVGAVLGAGGLFFGLQARRGQ